MAYDILKGLIFLGDKLFSIVPSFFAAKRPQRDRFADYCENISECLSRAYACLEDCKIPHGCCAEMDRYMKDLKDVLGDVLSPREYDELSEVLSVAYHVENLDRELHCIDREGSRYAELDIASGKFAAIANKIRATKANVK